jgi:integrase
MTVEIVARNGWLYAKVPRPRGAGRAIMHSLGTKSMEDAKQQVRGANLEQVALASQADALTREVWTRLLAGRRITVADSVQAYWDHRQVVNGNAKAIDRETSSIDQLIRFADFGVESIAIVSAKHVSEFVNRPGTQTLATRTRWLTTIKGWLDYCVAQRWIVVNPCLDVAIKVDQLSQDQLIAAPYVPFTEGEVKALLAAVPRADFWHGAILLAYHFGLRLGSVATLEESNIIAHDLRVYTLKGRRIVHERLPDELIEWFEEWRTHRDASDLPYLFPAQAALYDSNHTILCHQFTRLLQKCGIATDKSFHGLRKTATAKRWNAELAELGDRDRRSLIAMVAKNGFRAVQKMLAHADGSSVTEDHYMPREATTV